MMEDIRIEPGYEAKIVDGWVRFEKTGYTLDEIMAWYCREHDIFPETIESLPEGIKNYTELIATSEYFKVELPVIEPELDEDGEKVRYMIYVSEDGETTVDYSASGDYDYQFALFDSEDQASRALTVLGDDRIRDIYKR